MKLLRPLHRRRTRRQSQFTVLGNEDLAAHFDIQLEYLQPYLEKHGLPFHKDSCGNIWASCVATTPKLGCRAAQRR